MMEMLLLYAVVAPVVAGIVCLVAGNRAERTIKAFSSIVALTSFMSVLAVFIKKPVSWNYFGSPVLIADNLSAFVGLAVAFMALVVITYSCGFITKGSGTYFGYSLIALGASLTAVFTNSLILMIIAWDIVVVMLYLLVNTADTDKAAAAAKKALIIIGVTDALMIFGIGLVWARTGTFAIDAIHIPLGDGLSYMAYFCIAIAAFAKAGALPLHSWLPDVAEDAPTPVGAYLPASLDKLLGIYLLTRASLGLFEMSKISNLVLLIVGSVTILVAVMLALVQHNFKRLLGYHAISQVGYMVLGIGTATPIGIAGALFHMLNNALYKSCLFLTGGAVEKKAGSLDLGNLGGLAKYMPLTFIACLVAALSISGIPPFNGFFSKWLIYQGVIESATAKNPLWIVWLSAAMFGSALTIASFMKLVHAVFLGRASKEYKGITDPGILMTAPMLVLALVCIAFGVFAFLVPIPLLIMPAVGLKVAYLGTWQPLLATAAMLVFMVAGVVIYFASRPGKLRQTDVFVGGEDQSKLDRVSGTEFYDTVSDIKPIAALYKKEASGALDIYAISGKIIGFCARPVQILHNGVLPTYLVWCLLGMAGMFITIFIMAR